MADNNFRSDRGRDPLAGLARLIGQADPHGENAAANDAFREAGASHGCDEPSQLPPAHQLPGYPNAPEQAYEPHEHRHDDNAYQHADDEPYSADDYYEDEAPRAGRRSSVVLVMAVFGLAVVGTAGAFGYRATFGGWILPTLPPIVKASNEPSIALTSSKSQANNSANASQAGAATTASSEKLVSREEQPVTIEPAKPASPVISPIPIAKGQGSPPDMSTPVGGQAAPNQTTPGGVAAAANFPWPHPPAMAAPSTAPAAAAPAPAPQVSSEPRKIHTVTIRADQSGVADVSAESTRAHVAAAPTALANANSAAAVAFSGSGGGYSVQVTSERTESKAQAAFRALQAKYPNQLSGRQPIIRRADLGAKGTYYRALVGPFASAEKAAGLCSGLKAAGGNCIVQRN
jgi:hypothetical protein